MRVSRSVGTARIQQLEEFAGASLFHRKPRSVRLSELGQAFLRDCFELVFHLRDDVEPARGLRRHGQHRAAGVFRFWRLRDVDAGQLRRREPVRRRAARGRRGRADRGAGLVHRLPLAGRLLRRRHLGHRRGVSAELRQRVGGRGRVGHQPHGLARHRQGHARKRDVLDRARLPVPAQQARPGAVGDPRQQGRCRIAGHRRAGHEARRVRRRWVRRGPGRRSTSSATCASAPTPPSASTGRRSRSSWS